MAEEDKKKSDMILADTEGNIIPTSMPTQERMDAMMKIMQETRELFCNSDLNAEEIYLSLAWLKESFRRAAKEIVNKNSSSVSPRGQA